MPRYWVKLWTDIIGDRKTATLPDRAWRLYIECLVIAGIEDKDGLLPTTHDIAWTLRRDETQVTQDLEILARQPADPKQGPLLTQVDDHWQVTRFTERQAAVPAAKRKAMSRAVGSGDLAPLIAEDPLDRQFRKADEIYRKVTGQITIPSDSLDEATRVITKHLAANDNDDAKVIEILRPHFERWCKTKGKSGKPYAATNTTWLTTWSMDTNSNGHKPPEETNYDEIRRALTDD